MLLQDDRAYFLQLLKAVLKQERIAGLLLSSSTSSSSSGKNKSASAFAKEVFQKRFFDDAEWRGKLVLAVKELDDRLDNTVQGVVLPLLLAENDLRNYYDAISELFGGAAKDEEAVQQKRSEWMWRPVFDYLASASTGGESSLRGQSAKTPVSFWRNDGFLPQIKPCEEKLRTDMQNCTQQLPVLRLLKDLIPFYQDFCVDVARKMCGEGKILPEIIITSGAAAVEGDGAQLQESTQSFSGTRRMLALVHAMKNFYGDRALSASGVKVLAAFLSIPELLSHLELSWFCCKENNATSINIEQQFVSLLHDPDGKAQEVLLAEVSNHSVASSWLFISSLFLVSGFSTPAADRRVVLSAVSKALQDASPKKLSGEVEGIATSTPPQRTPAAGIFSEFFCEAATEATRISCAAERTPTSSTTAQQRAADEQFLTQVYTDIITHCENWDVAPEKVNELLSSPTADYTTNAEFLQKYSGKLFEKEKLHMLLSNMVHVNTGAGRGTTTGSDGPAEPTANAASPGGSAPNKKRKLAFSTSSASGSATAVARSTEIEGVIRGLFGEQITAAAGNKKSRSSDADGAASPLQLPQLVNSYVHDYPEVL
eukprot:GSA120T00006336001.1